MTDHTISIVDLGEKLTITEVTDCYTRLLEVLLEAKPVSVNSQQLQRLDAAGAQLLYSFQHACEQQEIQLQWSEPSAVLVESLSLLGLADKMCLANSQV